MTVGYDIIGDIHGQAEKLKALLIKMGYKISPEGHFFHPNRKAIFVADFIDRYPQQKEVLDIVRPMVDAGAAKASMGNHEFNAVCFATKHTVDDHVRPHTDKNKHQHKAFLDEFPFDTPEYREQIEWFKKLPVYLDLKDIFVVHACWNPKSIKEIKPHLNKDNTLKESAYLHYADESSDVFKSIEVLLMGPKHKLPEKVFFHDKNGVARRAARISWWKDKKSKTSERLQFGSAKLTEEEKNNIDKTSIREKFNKPSKPVFIGHYWMTGTPELRSEKVCCVDYSAGEDGDLVAYRWNGEKKLKKQNFFW